MREEKFTPGPWKVGWEKNPLLFPFIWQENGYAIAKMCGRPIDRLADIADPVNSLDDYADAENVLANARLIAAAPELYKELEKHCALCMMMHPDCEGCEICDTGKVLKKARGEK